MQQAEYKGDRDHRRARAPRHLQVLPMDRQELRTTGSPVADSKPPARETGNGPSARRQLKLRHLSLVPHLHAPLQVRFGIIPFSLAGRDYRARSGDLSLEVRRGNLWCIKFDRHTRIVLTVIACKSVVSPEGTAQAQDRSLAYSTAWDIRFSTPTLANCGSTRPRITTAKIRGIRHPR